MKGQDELFQLIKSLTSSEKRYFKVNASKGGDAKSNYMQLFEAMDAQKEDYDEEKVKKKYAKKSFVKYLSAEKKQLREQILKYMRGYHSARSIDNQINELLQDERFYQDKGLFDSRIKSILKAKELAQKFERFHLLKEILGRELAYTIEFEKKRITEPVVDLINEQKQLAITQATLLELQTRNRELFSIYRSGADIQDHKVESRVEMLISEVEMYRPRVSRCFTLGVQFNRAYANYHQILRDWSSSFEATKREYELYQKYDHFKEQDSYNYKLCLANLMSRANSAKEYDWFLKALEEMKTVPVHSFNEEGEVFQNIYFQEHLYYINAGEFDKAEALIPTIEEGLEKYEAKINKARYLTFQYNIMIMYFITHNFKKASEWANAILLDKSEIKENVKTVTKILLPMIHFELGHDELVENMTRSAYRHLINKQRIHSFEREVLRYFKVAPFQNRSDEFESKMNDFSSAINSLIAEENSSGMFGLEEVYLWIRHKKTGKPMHELLIQGSD